ncbi:MAG: GNAT family N-acetyltransferase [Thermoplasmatota archaeon]
MKKICEEKLIILRDAVPSDLNHYLSWMKKGEWREYDAPWELKSQDISDLKIKELFEKLFLGKKEKPRKRAIISTKKGRPLGWVTRYSHERFDNVWLVGIDICEDDFIGKGVGSEALKLWIDYLFINSCVHRVELNTHSFNIRMIRVAEKVGFEYEGKDRGIVRWKDKWIDRLKFGLLRREWK